VEAPPPVLVAGPGLPHALAEVAALRDRYPAAQCLTGADASVAAVAQALDGAGWVHLATHGRFRADNPLFSALVLADGPLTVHDIERLGSAPARLILSSCESGLSAVAPGDELMGLTAALLALGTTTVVASVVPVPDDATSALMGAMHAELAAGAPAAGALARARAALDPEDPRHTVAHAGFVCFGAG
jgi:CHAT domain-containing protein